MLLGEQLPAIMPHLSDLSFLDTFDSVTLLNIKMPNRVLDDSVGHSYVKSLA
jgi:hypothetical protein